MTTQSTSPIQSTNSGDLIPDDFESTRRSAAIGWFGGHCGFTLSPKDMEYSPTNKRDILGVHVSLNEKLGVDCFTPSEYIVRYYPNTFKMGSGFKVYVDGKYRLSLFRVMKKENK